jgi:hypothetical protein
MLKGRVVMSYFFVQLKPFEEDERSSQSLQPFQENSIRAGICGMGWKPAVDSIPASGGLVNDYWQAASNQNRGRNPAPFHRNLVLSLKYYSEIGPGDFVLTRVFGSSECYIGQVTSKAYYNDNALKKMSFENAEHYSWIVDVNWRRIGAWQDLSADAKPFFRYYGRRTINRILDHGTRHNTLVNLWDHE